VSALTSSTVRADRDVYRLAPSMEASALEMMAARLEFRATDERYVRLSQAYFTRLPLASAKRVLAVGCGTGVEVRALKRLVAADAALVGIDHSPTLVGTARKLTASEGFSDNVSYQTGDAHHLQFAEGEFDIVVLHTLISHVEDPLQVLHEARRVVRAGGTIAIFDGDYASMTFAYPDHSLAVVIEEGLKQIMVANPRVMRDMPRLLREALLELTHSGGELYADIGSGSFWANAAEAYGAWLARSEQLPPAVVDNWREFQKQSVQDNIFFGASNYYTFLARRAG
jgi:SAM-dependent methyltransferase